MKIIKTTYDGKKRTHYLFDIKKESCPICDTPLKDTYGRWNVFHGEITRSCCGSIWQVKDYSVSGHKTSGYKKFFKELNKDGIHEICHKKKMWKPLREAMKELGLNTIQDIRVYEKVKHLIT